MSRRLGIDEADRDEQVHKPHLETQGWSIRLLVLLLPPVVRLRHRFESHGPAFSVGNHGLEHWWYELMSAYAPGQRDEARAGRPGRERRTDCEAGASNGHPGGNPN